MPQGVLQINLRRSRPTACETRPTGNLDLLASALFRVRGKSDGALFALLPASWSARSVCPSIAKSFLSSQYKISLAAGHSCVAVGGTMIIVLAASNTLLQSMVPDELRGRVMALYSMVFMGTAPFGALAAGTIAQHGGAPLAVALGGACINGAGVFAWHLPALRHDARELILSLEAAAGLPAQQDAAEAVMTDRPSELG
jgi:hypothetical protein